MILSEIEFCLVRMIERIDKRRGKDRINSLKLHVIIR